MGYSTQTDIENVYGAMDVAQWSNFTPGAVTANTTRVNVAISLANAEIDAYLKSGPYAIPIVGTATNPPTMIVLIEATLAGYWLWDTRNLHKVKDEVPEMKRKAKDARTQLNMIVLSRLPIAAVLNTARSTAPRVSAGGQW